MNSYVMVFFAHAVKIRKKDQRCRWQNGHFNGACDQTLRHGLTRMHSSTAVCYGDLPEGVSAGGGGYVAKGVYLE